MNKMKNIIKKFFVSLICISAMMTISNVNALDYIDTYTYIEEEFDDGSYIEVTVEQSNVLTRASSITGKKTASYKGSSGTIYWSVTVTGTFTYNGTTASCTKSSVSTKNNSVSWKLSNAKSSKSGATALASVTAKQHHQDGTVLKTFGSHGVFSIDLLKYVIVNDPKEFHVGTNVVKIDKNGNKKIVKVKKIETIKDEITYYHVSSTRYHNILANDILTTDGTGLTSYLYTFTEDLIWGKDREEYLKTGDLFKYEEWALYFPKYLFMGYRMGEAKNVFNKGLLDAGYLIKLLNVNNTKPIMKDSYGDNIWMVTTSDDIVTSANKDLFLYKEDSFYTLKEPKKKKNFIGWLNTGDNKIYQAGDKVKIVYGTHFIAKYKDV